SVQIKTLFEIERQLAGETPDKVAGFKGLNSPKWPTNVLPAINTALAARGSALYRDRCKHCHLPPVWTPEFWESDRWTAANAAGERYLDLHLIDLKHIGTDPAQAEDMKNRRAIIPDGLGIKTDDFGLALGQVVQKTMERWYSEQSPPISNEEQDIMNGQ